MASAVKPLPMEAFSMRADAKRRLATVAQANAADVEDSVQAYDTFTVNAAYPEREVRYNVGGTVMALCRVDPEDGIIVNMYTAVAMVMNLFEVDLREKLTSTTAGNHRGLEMQPPETCVYSPAKERVVPFLRHAAVLQAAAEGTKGLAGLAAAAELDDTREFSEDRNTIAIAAGNKGWSAARTNLVKAGAEDEGAFGSRAGLDIPVEDGAPTPITRIQLEQVKENRRQAHAAGRSINRGTIDSGLGGVFLRTEKGHFVEDIPAGVKAEPRRLTMLQTISTTSSRTIHDARCVTCRLLISDEVEAWALPDGTTIPEVAIRATSGRVVTKDGVTTLYTDEVYRVTSMGTAITQLKTRTIAGKTIWFVNGVTYVLDVARLDEHLAELEEEELDADESELPDILFRKDRIERALVVASSVVGGASATWSGIPTVTKGAELYRRMIPSSARIEQMGAKDLARYISRAGEEPYGVHEMDEGQLRNRLLAHTVAVRDRGTILRADAEGGGRWEYLPGELGRDVIGMDPRSDPRRSSGLEPEMMERDPVQKKSYDQWVLRIFQAVYGQSLPLPPGYTPRPGALSLDPATAQDAYQMIEEAFCMVGSAVGTRIPDGSRMPKAVTPAHFKAAVLSFFFRRKQFVPPVAPASLQRKGGINDIALYVLKRCTIPDLVNNGKQIGVDFRKDDSRPWEMRTLEMWLNSAGGSKPQAPARSLRGILESGCVRKPDKHFPIYSRPTRYGAGAYSEEEGGWLDTVISEIGETLRKNDKDVGAGEAFTCYLRHTVCFGVVYGLGKDRVSHVYYSARSTDSAQNASTTSLAHVI